MNERNGTMSKISIVTDSTSDIPQELMQKLNIYMVPLKVHFGEESYLDRKEMTAERFYKKLAHSPSFPTTSQPSPNDFLNVYKKILNQDPTQSIISIHLSSALSGTYQSAIVAKSMLGEEADITVVDSKSASYGIGMLAVAAATAARNGKDKETCLEILEKLKTQRKLYFYVDTLEFLQRGGRIGKAAALLGSLLQIKPILSIDQEGEVYAVDKVRGSKKAKMRILELFRQQFEGKDVHVVIAHTICPDEAEQWEERLKQEFQVKDVLMTEIGSVIGAHTGFGAVGIFMYPVIQHGSN